ncbi:uncharacterized protein LOC133386159 [Rhineura floridana]|uniref:uncharacterized protein LOC133386159 n=1 Tax=Rhineura floridana TaxID=261503 RepID=UPI002AC801E3|nr:uncharacterized protein LOC133386159 [Rhineura floridana]
MQRTTLSLLLPSLTVPGKASPAELGAVTGRNKGALLGGGREVGVPCGDYAGPYQLPRRNSGHASNGGTPGRPPCGPGGACDPALQAETVLSGRVAGVGRGQRRPRVSCRAVVAYGRLRGAGQRGQGCLSYSWWVLRTRSARPTAPPTLSPAPSQGRLRRAPPEGPHGRRFLPTQGKVFSDRDRLPWLPGSIRLGQVLASLNATIQGGVQSLILLARLFPTLILLILAKLPALPPSFSSSASRQDLQAPHSEATPLPSRERQRALGDFPAEKTGAPVEALVKLWNAEMTRTVDTIAPARPLLCRAHAAPWYTPELRAMKQNRRWLERKWRRISDRCNYALNSRAGSGCNTIYCLSPTGGEGHGICWKYTNPGAHQVPSLTIGQPVTCTGTASQIKRVPKP